MKNKQPFFSIVIPTRNRADTLKHSIQTILNQSFEDYEIIICNNNSIDNTEEIVRDFTDNRMKYIKSEIDLSMSDNWELAYTQVKGKYVTYMADNDGFIDGSLSFLYKLLKLYNYPNILRWEKNQYNWPCLDSINKNILRIKLNKKIHVCNSDSIIKEIIGGKRDYPSLPMIYTSFIKKTLIDSFKSETGRLFHSTSPDLSTGFSFAGIERNFLSLSYGITCGANSSKSNGHNCLRKKDNNISKDFKNLMDNSKIKFHPHIPYVKSFTAAVVESYLRIKNILESKNFDLLDIKQAYINIIKDVAIFDGEDLMETQNRIIESSKFNSELFNFVNTYLEKNPLKINIIKENKYEKGFDISNNTLTLKGEDFDLFNITDVCKFMGAFYNYSLEDLSFPDISLYNLNIIEDNAKIAIWGNGLHSKNFQELILKERKDLKIHCIIDSFKEDTKKEIPIFLPQNVEFFDIDYLIIASTFLNEIKETLLSVNLQKTRVLKY
jgi:glycosyltransferase involved in cell wall biosynthesis